MPTALTNSFRVFKVLDARLTAAVLAMGVISVVNLAGIAGSDHTLVWRQVVLLAVGLLLMTGAASLNYRYFKNWTVPVVALYGVSVALVASTFFFSQIRNIRAWISIGGFQFEPSEFIKLALIVLLAKYFSQRHVHINQFRHIIASGLYAVVPAALVLLQPDLGSAVIIMVVWGAMLLSVGISRRHLFLLIVVAIVGGYLAWIYALAPYQKERVLAFVDPYRDPSGYGYHIIQSQIAIGSGGLWGVGLGHGSQATLGFLPEPANDFAFAALAEQFGLVGIGVVMALMVTIVWRVLAIGSVAGNNFARLFCVGVATIITAHVFISASVNIGLLPITGIPFTLLSYGGSHLWSVLAALGIVQSTASHA